MPDVPKNIAVKATSEKHFHVRGPMGTFSQFIMHRASRSSRAQVHLRCTCGNKGALFLIAGRMYLLTALTSALLAFPQSGRPVSKKTVPSRQDVHLNSTTSLQRKSEPMMLVWEISAPSANFIMVERSSAILHLHSLRLASLLDNRLSRQLPEV